MTTRADQIYARFVAFHRANPQVWVLFQRYADEARRAGFHTYSSYSIIERIRWHVAMETRSMDGLKINNDFRPYYARMYLATHPAAGGFFEMRCRTSARRPACARDQAVAPSAPPGDEGDLLDALAQLADG